MQGQFFSMNGHFISFDKLLPLRTSFTINWIQSRENWFLNMHEIFFFWFVLQSTPNDVGGVGSNSSDDDRSRCTHESFSSFFLFEDLTVA